MRNKILSYVLLVVFTLVTAILAFDTINLLFNTIVNYEALSKTALASFPMYMFFATVLTLLLYFYGYVFKINTFASLKKYLLPIIVFSGIGVISSIIVGTFVYGSFMTPYIFKGYTIVMLVVHILLLGLAITAYIYTKKIIKKNNLPEAKKLSASQKTGGVFVIVFLIYALNRLGAFLYMPIYFSPVDSIMVLPYYFILPAPILFAIVIAIYRFVKLVHPHKFAFICAMAIGGYSLFAIVLTAVLSNIYSEQIINPLSMIHQFERLVVFPIDMIAISLATVGVSIIILIMLNMKYRKERKACSTH